MKRLILLTIICINFSFACSNTCNDPMLPGMQSMKSQALYQQAEVNLALHIDNLNAVLKNAVVQTENNNRRILEQNLALQKENLFNKEKEVFTRKQQNQVQSIINSVESN